MSARLDTTSRKTCRCHHASVAHSPRTRNMSGVARSCWAGSPNRRRATVRQPLLGPTHANPRTTTKPSSRRKRKSDKRFFAPATTKGTATNRHVRQQGLHNRHLQRLQRQQRLRNRRDRRPSSTHLQRLQRQQRLRNRRNRQPGSTHLPHLQRQHGEPDSTRLLYSKHQ